jgi:anti-sigma factor RsiW
MFRPGTSINPYIGAMGCLLMGAAIGVPAGWVLSAWRSGDALADAGFFAPRAALAHAVYAPEVRHPVEVWAEEKPHLVAWLSKRLQAEVRAPDFADAGFALLGGRLLPGEGAVGTDAPLPVAQFMYENAAGRRVTLYLRNARAREPRAEPRYMAARGVGVMHWARDGLAYALASVDVSRAELDRLVHLTRRGNP